LAKQIATWANLDFEAELANPNNYQPAAIAASLCQRWSHVLRLLPELRQSLCLDPLHPEINQRFERLVAWGVTPRSIALADQLSAARFPALEPVRRINDKRYSHQLEKRLGAALPNSQVVATCHQLQEAAQSCPFDWVLKHPFSYSGRERIFGKAHQLSQSAQGWARKKLDAGWTLLFEPWVERQHDFSLHFEISPSGQIDFIGWCSLISDKSGGYRGNFVNRQLQLEAEALNYGYQVASQLACEGYWGPVGIDALMGHLGHQPVLRPLVEINARYSFGRLTLALADWIPSNWSYLWWHPSRAQSGLLNTSLPALPSESSKVEAGIYQLPLAADPDQHCGTALVVASSYAQVQRLYHNLEAGS
jgi:hypothetical protein